MSTLVTSIRDAYSWQGIMTTPGRRPCLQLLAQARPTSLACNAARRGAAHTALLDMFPTARCGHIFLQNASISILNNLWIYPPFYTLLSHTRFFTLLAQDALSPTRAEKL